MGQRQNCALTRKGQKYTQTLWPRFLSLSLFAFSHYKTLVFFLLLIRVSPVAPVFPLSTASATRGKQHFGALPAPLECESERVYNLLLSPVDWKKKNPSMAQGWNRNTLLFLFWLQTRFPCAVERSHHYSREFWVNVEILKMLLTLWNQHSLHNFKFNQKDINWVFKHMCFHSISLWIRGSFIHILFLHRGKRGTVCFAERATGYDTTAERTTLLLR